MTADGISVNQENYCLYQIRSFTDLITLSPLFEQSSDTLILSYHLSHSSLNCALMLPVHLCVGLQNCIFLSGFLINTFCELCTVAYYISSTTQPLNLITLIKLCQTAN
jgi:hypothetical protein